MAAVVSGDDASDDDIAVFAELWTIAVRECVPDDPEIPAAEIAAELRLRPSHARTWLIREGDDGAAVLHTERRGTNEHLAWLEMAVRPAARRAGVGSAVLAGVCDAARADGRNLVITEALVGHEGAEGFARHHGFVAGLLVHENRLRTAEVDRSLLEQWVADATTAAAGYSLVAWDGLPPDDAYPQISTCAQAMQDAPTSEAVDADWNHTPENEREEYAAWAAQGSTVWTLAARHDATGAMAGYTQIRSLPHRPTLVYQENTGVLPDHRGHGLGRWLKAVNALRVLDEWPQVEQVITGNAGSNEHMLGINHAMGFRLAGAMQGWELSL
jgi:mycothiol synthase